MCPAVYVVFQKGVRVFHRGFKHKKTDESTLPATKHKVSKSLLQQKKISLIYHLNKVSEFNYYF